MRHNNSAPSDAAVFEGPKPCFKVSLLALLGGYHVPLVPAQFAPQGLFGQPLQSHDPQENRAPRVVPCGARGRDMWCPFDVLDQFASAGVPCVVSESRDWAPHLSV